MNVLRFCAKFVGYLVCYVIYPFSFLLPRCSKVLAFGSYRGAFNDNTKYLFIYASEHLKSCTVVWLSSKRSTVQQVRSLGLNAYTVFSPQGVYYALRSGYWFVNSYTSDIIFCLAGRAKVVNLWHGVPMKRIEFGITQGELAKRYVDRDFWEVFFHPACFRRPDYLLSTSVYMDDVFAEAFRIDKLHCLHAGYPRNELLLATAECVQSHIDRYESDATKQLVAKLRQFDKVYVYMPTWRDAQLDCFAPGFDLGHLNACLRLHNSCMLMKPHSNTRIDGKVAYDNLLFVDGGVDMYCVLPFTDVLITDYSSVLYDYLIMPDKQVVLFHYDYEEYVRSREFSFPMESHIAGKRVYTFDQLLETITSGNCDVDVEERQRVLNKFWGETLSGTPCRDILQQLRLM